MALQIGQAAPDFTLFDTEKKEVTLSSFKGQPVLILFFPQSFTGVCTTELCSVRDNIAQYNDVNAKVLAISVDSVFTLGRFKEDQNLNFTLLSDFNKEVSAAYGSLYDNFVFGMKGVSKRSAFLVDKDGNIAYEEVLENAGEIPNFNALMNVLKSL
ncbi:MAG: redoxin domain-containing protein [Chitinophagaceae bacterium]|jgi:peroxiredoxin|nr:redoxin domain-containing protein [Chitinophagaceae bacterium]